MPISGHQKFTQAARAATIPPPPKKKKFPSDLNISYLADSKVSGNLGAKIFGILDRPAEREKNKTK